MKQLLVWLAAALMLHANTTSAAGIPKKFRKLLEEDGMQFSMPEGYRQVPVHKNPDMYYDFAIRSKTKKLEIRYSIFPLQSIKETYDKSKTDTSISAVAPDRRFASTLMLATTLNIMDSVLQDITPFDSEAVKKEFGADWGAFSLVVPRPTYAKNYTFCIIVAIHKDNIADGYITYLFDNLSDVSDDIYGEGFYNLRFKR